MRGEVKRFKGEGEQTEVKTPTGSVDELTPVQSDLIEKLIRINVSRGIAEELAKNYEPDLIEKWIEAVRYTRAQNPAAYIVKAIKEGWSFPEEYLKALREKQLLISEREREERERKKIREEIKKLDDLYDTLSPAQKASIDREIKEKLPSFAKEKLMKGETDSPALKAAWEKTKMDVMREWIKLGKINCAGVKSHDDNRDQV